MSLNDTTKTETTTEAVKDEPKADAVAPADTKGGGQPAPKAADAPAEQPKADAGKPAAADRGDATSIFDDAEDEEPAEPAKAEAEAKEGEGESKAASVPFPEDWRERIAQGDEKHLSELQRFKSFETYAKSQRALRQKLASGEFKRAEEFDDGWADDKKAAWRKDNGVPEKAEDYAMPEIKGHEWTDADKAAAAPFLERMHARNARPEVVQEAMGFYAQAVAQAKEQMHSRDREERISLEDTLRDDWGNDYRANINLMKRALGDNDLIPGGMEKGGLGEMIMQARLPDGARLINQPGMAQFLAGLARQTYGETSMVPVREGAVLSSRKVEIEKVMSTDMDRYYREKNAKGQTLEQEYREILERLEGGGNGRKRAA